MVTLRPMGEPALDWASQVCQYPYTGEPGIGYFAGVVTTSPVPVDCLLWRCSNGHVRGILNHYAVDYPPFETAGNVNIWVQRQWQRQGIASALFAEAESRWGPIDLTQQRYTAGGAAFARHLIEERGL